MDGCRRLELWVDTTSLNLVTTYSEWDSELSLNRYRESDLFQKTWAQAKLLFAAPATAHTYRPHQNID